jgi:hypothetical protein
MHSSLPLNSDVTPTRGTTTEKSITTSSKLPSPTVLKIITSQIAVMGELTVMPFLEPPVIIVFGNKNSLQALAAAT